MADKTNNLLADALDALVSAVTEEVWADG